MVTKFSLSLIQNCKRISLALLIICSNPELVRSQALNANSQPNLTQSLPRLESPPQNIIPPPRPETPRPSTSPSTPPPNNLLQIPRAIPPTEQTPSGIPGTFVVKQFWFVGNTAFSSKSLAIFLNRFIDRPITFPELLQARNAVTSLYNRKGYITSGSYIPPQTFAKGIIVIKVVEGRLEKIKVTGTRRLKSNYVLERLKLGTSKPLNRNRLLEALQLLQLNPLIKSISAQLAAGSRPGTSVLEIEVTEAKTFIPQLTLANNRPPSVGTFERGLQVEQANLLGLGDSLAAGYSNTDGSNNVNASYTLPLNARNGALSLSYGSTISHVVEPPFNRLRIDANYRYYDLMFRQPLFQTALQELALGLTASRRESDTSLLGSRALGREISPGSDQRGRTRISAIRFFQDWTKRSSREVFAARSQFSLGVGALDATIHKTPPDGRFLVWQGQGQWVRFFAPDTLLLVRGTVQVASRPLVPLEQFGLGGVETVRGFRQDLLLTDSGATASLEFRVPVLRISLHNVFQLTPFIDFGYGWNASRRIRVGPNNTLASVGIGLRWQIGNNFSARLDYGIPLVDVSSRNRTLQEQGISFSLQYNTF